MDGIDAALVDIHDGTCRLVASHLQPWPAQLATELRALRRSDTSVTLNKLGQLDRDVGLLFARATKNLLASARCSPEEISAIGSHGQTVRHNTTDSPAFSLQIGDPNTIAHETGITTVADFRRMDIARGGEGAPLAPLFHDYLVGHRDFDVVIVNLGGVANVTVLSQDGQVQGFDTGPANNLMDFCLQERTEQRFDDGGQLAAAGKVDEPLLKTLMQHPFFELPPPKSTGFETFNYEWLQKTGGARFADLAIEDALATLARLSALTIANAIAANCDASHLGQIYLCGGGVQNLALIRELQTAVTPTPLASIDSLGIGADWIEAALFAWLARQRLDQAALPLAGITGAPAGILGGVYLP